MLQGGGALGSYQAGIYEAMAETRLSLDWVAGISVGAVNAALIAGNPPEQRVEKLRPFWDTITTNPLLDWVAVHELLTPRGDLARRIHNAISANYTLAFARRIFSRLVSTPRSSMPMETVRRRVSTTRAHLNPRWSDWSISTASITARCAFRWAL